MHGTIFMALAEFAEDKLGEGAFSGMTEWAGLGERRYEERATYPDGEAVALLRAASHALGHNEAWVFEEFGRFLGPRLLREYGGLLHASWHTLEVLEYTEVAIHRVVRVHDPGADPPEIRAHRLGRDAVRVHYVSRRRMCALARGLIHGLADHFGERVDVLEEACANRGRPDCIFLVQRLERSPHHA